MNKTRVRYTKEGNDLISGLFLTGTDTVQGIINTNVNSLVVKLNGVSVLAQSFTGLTEAKTFFKNHLKELGVQFLGETRLHVKDNISSTVDVVTQPVVE